MYSPLFQYRMFDEEDIYLINEGCFYLMKFLSIYIFILL